MGIIADAHNLDISFIIFFICVVSEVTVKMRQHDENEAKDIKAPCVGEARTGVYVESIKKAKALINDRPVFAGMIGPFSLAARLVDVDNSMIYCKRKPELMH